VLAKHVLANKVEQDLRQDGALRAEDVKLGGAKAEAIMKIMRDGCFAILKARRNLRHKNVTVGEPCVILAHLAEAPLFWS
jgi:hypothetical protein